MLLFGSILPRIDYCSLVEKAKQSALRDGKQVTRKRFEWCDRNAISSLAHGLYRFFPEQAVVTAQQTRAIPGPILQFVMLLVFFKYEFYYKNSDWDLKRAIWKIWWLFRPQI